MQEVGIGKSHLINYYNKSSKDLLRILIIRNEQHLTSSYIIFTLYSFMHPNQQIIII